MTDKTILGDLLEAAAEYYAETGIKPRTVYVGADIMPELREEICDHRDKLVEARIEKTLRSRLYVDGMVVKLVHGDKITFSGDVTNDTAKD